MSKHFQIEPDGDHPFSVEKGLESLGAQQIVDALAICNKFLNDDTALLCLYAPVARLFKGTATDEAILTAITTSRNIGFKVCVGCPAGDLHEADLQCIPNTGIGRRDPHMLVMNMMLANLRVAGEDLRHDDRVVYFLVCKVFRELVHAFTPFFYRLTDAYAEELRSGDAEQSLRFDAASDMSEMAWERQVTPDCASVFEQAFLGGSLITAHVRGRSKFRAGLSLVAEDTSSAAERAKFVTIPYPEEHIALKLQELRAWGPGAPVPDLLLPAQRLEELIAAARDTAPSIQAGQKRPREQPSGSRSGDWDEADTEPDGASNGESDAYAKPSDNEWKELIELGQVMTEEQCRLHALGHRF